MEKTISEYIDNLVVTTRKVGGTVNVVHIDTTDSHIYCIYDTPEDRVSGMLSVRGYFIYRNKYRWYGFKIASSMLGDALFVDSEIQNAKAHAKKNP